MKEDRVKGTLSRVLVSLKLRDPNVTNPGDIKGMQIMAENGERSRRNLFTTALINYLSDEVTQILRPR